MFTIKLIAIIIFFTVACAGLGSFFLQLKPFRNIEKINKSNLRYLLIAYLVGQGIFSFAWLFLAIIGAFYPIYIFILLFVPFLLAIYVLPKKIIEMLKEIRMQVPNLFRFEAGWGLIGIICIVFYLAAFTSFGRPLGGDAAQLYMTWAKLISSTHHFVLVPGQTLASYVGVYSELIYASMMSLEFRDAGRLNDLVIAAICFLLLLHIGVNLKIKGQGIWVILAILFSSSVFVWLIGKGTADIYACTLALAAFFLLLPEEQDFNKPSYFLAGFLGGLSFYAKLSYLLGFFPVLIFFIIIRFFSTQDINSIKQFWKSKAFTAILVFGIGLLIGFSPLLFKNAAVFGNPLMAFNGLGSTYIDPDFQQESIAKIRMAFPLSLFFGSFSFQSGRLSPLILAFFPICFLVNFFRKPFRSNLVLQVTLAALMGSILWLVFRPQVFILRYFLASLLLLCFMPAYSIELLFQKHNAKVLPIIIIGAMAITLLSELSTKIGVYFYPKETYNYLNRSLLECEKDGHFCAALREINRDAAPGDRILFANWFGYWLRPDLIQCMVSETDKQVYQLTPVSRYSKTFIYDDNGQKRRPTFNDLWIEIYERGFKYIVRYTKPEAEAGKLDLGLMDSVPWVKLISLYNDGELEVYRIEYISPPSEIKVKCIETQPDLWQLKELD